MIDGFFSPPIWSFNIWIRPNKQMGKVVGAPECFFGSVDKLINSN